MSSNVPAITPVFTRKACPPAGPYSQAIRFPLTTTKTATAKPTSQVFISGQIPADDAGTLTSGSIATKTAQCLRNLKCILEASGASMSTVVKVGVFLTDMKNFDEMNGEYETWFGGDGEVRPARTCVAVHQLPKGVEVEIEAVALVFGEGEGEG